MENNEIMMNEEIEVMDDAVVAEEGNGVSTGVAMLIGAGLALAVGAGTKLAKKGYVAIKAKLAEKKQAKAAAEPEPENVVETVAEEKPAE